MRKLLVLILLMFGLNAAAQKFECDEVISGHLDYPSYKTTDKANITVDIQLENRKVTFINNTLKDTVILRIIGSEVDEDIPEVHSYMGLVKGEEVIFQIVEINHIFVAVGVSKNRNVLVYKFVEQKQL